MGEMVRLRSGRGTDIPAVIRGMLVGRLRWASVSWRLLADAFRISLAAEFGEKGVFLQPIAGPQQFQQGIVGIGGGAAGADVYKRQA